MKLKVFLQDNIPLGKGSVKIPIKGLVEGYRDRYNKIKNELKFTHDIYTIQPGGRMIVHVKVPSETVKNFWYDILIEVEPSGLVTKIEDCDIKLFSNSPSFVYSYAHTFYHLDPDFNDKDKTDKKLKKNDSGMLIDTLRRKIPKNRLLVHGAENTLPEEVLYNEPVVRNPAGIPLPDKTIYYGIFYILDNLTLNDIKKSRRYRTEGQLLSSVTDFDTLMAKRKQAEARQKAATARERARDMKSIKTTEHSVRKANNTVKLTKPKSAVKPVSTQRSKSVTKIGRK